METNDLLLLEAADSIEMAVMLDRKTVTERVLIGPKRNVQAYLKGKVDASTVRCMERPLGQLILDMDKQDFGYWGAKMLCPLRSALCSLEDRAENERYGVDFLWGERHSGNAVAIFTAEQAQTYYNALRTPEGDEGYAYLFDRRITPIIHAFRKKILTGDVGCSAKQAMQNVTQILTGEMRYDEAEVQIRYPSRGCQKKCMETEGPLLPVMLEYLRCMKEWGYGFGVCQVCGKWFVKKNGNRALCGNPCQRVQKRRHSSAYRNSPKRNEADTKYNSCTQQMRRYKKDFKEREGITKAQVEAVEAFYAQIRKEAVDRKKSIKTEKDFRDFKNWLLAMEAELKRMCGG